MIKHLTAQIRMWFILPMHQAFIFRFFNPRHMKNSSCAVFIYGSMFCTPHAEPRLTESLLNNSN